MDVGPRPNGIAYDAGRRNAFAFDLGEPIGANCSASVVSLDEMTVIATIPLPGRPRWAVYDAERNLVYANIREPAQIIVIDAGSLRIVAAFDVPSVGPHGLALVDDRLFSAADAGKLVALHRDDGHMIGSADLPGEPDVIMSDAEEVGPDDLPGSVRGHLPARAEPAEPAEWPAGDGSGGGDAPGSRLQSSAVHQGPPRGTTSSGISARQRVARASRWWKRSYG